MAWFHVVDLYRKLYVYLQLDQKYHELIEKGINFKQDLSAGPIGKPLVDQFDLAHQTAKDILAQTQEIIVILPYLIAYIEAKKKDNQTRLSVLL
jgi:hypothetical protein